MTHFTIPFTNQYLGGETLMIIGARPQMGRTVYAMRWLEKYGHIYSEKENKPCFIFINNNENALLKYIDLNALNNVNRIHLEFGEHERLLNELFMCYQSNPPFVFIHGYESLFERYSENYQVDALPNSILVKIKKLILKYKIPTVITTHIHSDDSEGVSGIYRPQLIHFGSSTYEIVADEIYALYRSRYYGVEELTDEKELSTDIELIYLKGQNANHDIYKIRFDMETLKLMPPPMGTNPY